MKTRITHSLHQTSGYALLMVLIIGAAAVLVLGVTMSRTGTVSLLNDRNNQYIANLNAAEAAVEKVIARLAYDFQTFGPGAVQINKGANIYATNVPNASESAYWSRFEFSNGRGNVGRTYVEKIADYTGPLPSAYPGLTAVNAPVYRVLSNVRPTSGPYQNMTNAIQEDVLLAMVPITQYAIFYNGLLEFSTCATMTVNGRTHANGSIYVGSGSTLTFNGMVTTTGTISSPANNGSGPWFASPGRNKPDWKVDFNGQPEDYRTNQPTITLSINMTNTHSLIDMPPAGESITSLQGKQRLYNQAQTVLVVTNNAITFRVQTPAPDRLPAEDATPFEITTNYTPATLAGVLKTNFPFLSLTNTPSFRDQREDKDILVTQIDVGHYAAWLETNANVLAKFPAGNGAFKPTILYVADNRTTTSSQLAAVRITNGRTPPANSGLGWSLATPNPLYVLGNYNCTNTAQLHSTNTSSAIPSALISDALTILSDSWQDSVSFTTDSSGPGASDRTTVNAAILTGSKPSTGNSSSQFSGGVHNLPRLLEDWSGDDLWLNTSIINLFASTKATGQFVTPGSGSYYVPPTRHFSFDLNFLDYNKVPPGIPSALVAIRKNWATPPAHTLTYNATP